MPRTKSARARHPLKAIPTATDGPGRPFSRYLVLWWHLQKMYVGLFENETEATLHAAARNGVVVELIASDLAVGAIEDYWRRDDQGRPMPGEWRTSRALVAA